MYVFIWYVVNNIACYFHINTILLPDFARAINQNIAQQNKNIYQKILRDWYLYWMEEIIVFFNCIKGVYKQKQPNLSACFFF